MFDYLPESLRKHATEDETRHYSLAGLTQSEFEALLDEFEIEWSENDSRERVEADKRQFPLADIELSGARTTIDFDALSIRDSKYVLAANSYADVSGFTAFVESATTDGAKAEALKAFHVIRREHARVIKSDYDAVRVQYQGDRVQGLTHLPTDDWKAIATAAVETAIGLQSSFEITLKEALPSIQKLGLAVGVGLGWTVATKLGPRGHRDRICLGDAVSRAERNEENVDKGEIGIDKATYDQLDDALRARFAWNNPSRCYVAAGLTWEKVEAESVAEALRRGAIYVGPAGGATRISPSPTPGTRRVTPSSSWGPSER